MDMAPLNSVLMPKVTISGAKMEERIYPVVHPVLDRLINNLRTWSNLKKRVGSVKIDFIPAAEFHHCHRSLKIVYL